jgi:hypothetical protein
LLAAGMSSPLGLPLAAMFGLWRGELAGDKEYSEYVTGDSGPFLDEFQPKKEVNPPAGDLGLPWFPRLSGRYESSNWASATPSNLSFRSVGRTSAAYADMLGRVGERACVMTGFRCRRGW